MTHHGKYRATVTNNLDPLSQGRLQIDCPLVAVSGVWAEACIPNTDPSHGVLTLPAIGAEIWIEFEAGRVDYPIWTGVRWPAAAASDLVLLTTSGATLSLLANGSVEITSAGKVAVTAATVEVTAATVNLHTPIAKFDGVLECDALIAASSVTSPVYSPGVGNVW
ncbi:hypothetical protein SAMN05892883_3984 [Jatrophihabitans sp. GAS493]|uniref:phage baseplate assembly protein V n=1 Tax=Jatrophihabitans sp. GAS493 TaxID=1907575 RepID=UPI000BC03C20|nr:phage baseplate assembly protein V [Jatrophihabitans sp. GAS493]SOD74793.1 hypothetical protein SAMN05892883_3984 [Jatrophihabitans sp. GAS493]